MEIHDIFHVIEKCVNSFSLATVDRYWDPYWAQYKQRAVSPTALYFFFISRATDKTHIDVINEMLKLPVC